MTGGACQEERLAEIVSEDVKLRVNLAESPINTVALGLSQVIKKNNYRSLAYMIEGLGK
jgi:rod shape-determining protein MreB